MRTALLVAGILATAAFAGCGGSSFTSTGGDDASVDGSSSTDAMAGDAGGGVDSGGGSEAGVDSGGGADSGGDSGATTCIPGCVQGRSCCEGACVNTDNDPDNCGGCATRCNGNTPYCDGTCKAAPCIGGGTTCTGATTCCGSMCCTTGQICCKDDGPVTEATCFTPTAAQSSCPPGCSPQCVSDRDAKTGIVPVADRDVLEALAGVPMSTWSYKVDDPNVRHLGPMAQDLQTAFGLGSTDRAYDPIDAHGVALSSIKALYAMALEQNARIEKLELENERLRARVEAQAPTTCGGGR
jgi:hypothetical protein